MGYGFKRQAFGDVLMNLVPERIDAYNRQKLLEQEEAQRGRQIDLQEKGFGLQERQFQADEADKDRAWTELTAWQKAQIENDQAQLKNQQAYQGGVLGVQRDQFGRQEKRDLSLAEEAIWTDLGKEKTQILNGYTQQSRALGQFPDQKILRQLKDDRDQALRNAYSIARSRFQALGSASGGDRTALIEAQLQQSMGEDGLGNAGGIDPRWDAFGKKLGSLINPQGQ